MIERQHINITSMKLNGVRKSLLFLFAVVCLTTSTKLDAYGQSEQSENRAQNAQVQSRVLKLTPRKISLGRNRSFNLNVPDGFEITVAASGLRRVRFMAISPDGRLFVTDMYNLTDNNRGAVYVLDDFDAKTGKFNKVIPYMTGLRNPNSIVFHTDKQGNDWFYLALTDRLLRYKYTKGEEVPQGTPETLATFPDYGLSYKYGGWHLTRTISIGTNEKLYVSVGSSCNACEEKEEIRATIVEMDLDGSNQKFYARGLRNAVGIKWVEGQLYASNMGADHLGDDSPEDAMHQIREGANYGWPYCFEQKASIQSDPLFAKSKQKIDCSNVPLAMATTGAHSSPLGFEYFDKSATDPLLKNFFLVALHGSSKKNLNRGYRIVRLSKGSRARDFITGFMQRGRIYGRPADVIRFGRDSFLFTDDQAGIVYYVYKKPEKKEPEK
jgi:glucose/arabinose dehydrogenase